MAEDYTVFSRRILTGTLTDLPYATRLAWVAVMFEAEKLRGRVKLPVADLANAAKITRAEAAAALEAFQQPDPFSSSKVDEGRRLRAVPGEDDWYDVVTWEKHAAEKARYFARLRQQRARNRDAGGESNGVSRSVTKELEPELEPEEEKKDLASLGRKSAGEQRHQPSAAETEVRSILRDAGIRITKTSENLIARWANSPGPAELQKLLEDHLDAVQAADHPMQYLNALVRGAKADADPKQQKLPRGGGNGSRDLRAYGPAVGQWRETYGPMYVGGDGSERAAAFLRRFGFSEDDFDRMAKQ